MQPVKLSHFTTVEDLTTEQVFNLIKRAEEFKNGAKPTPLTKPVYVTNMFLKIHLEHILVLKWQKEN